MKLVFLVSDYMPHQLTTINTLIENYQAEILSVTFKESIPTKVLPEHSFFHYNGEQRDDFLKTILEFNPIAVVVAGWFFDDFVWISKQIRKRIDIPVVAYSDTQWSGSFKQRINCILSPFHLKKAFSHIWVSGIYQYEYARKLQYSKSNIIMHSLSCSKEYFTGISNPSFEIKREFKKLLFVGRFVEVKGLDLLLKAWSQIPDKNGWRLTLVGEGPLKNELKYSADVEIKDFMNNENLIIEMRNSDCFILPSIFEPWGVVIHEAVASGLPVIATNICGAVPHFVINNFNGLVVEPKVESILRALRKLIAMSSVELERFSKNSKMLANRITPNDAVASIYSLIR